MIIPVYNAGEYVERAIRSALDQPQVSEVVLVEDGSPDNSLEVCQRMADEDERVHLFRHPNGENRGAGSTRNLGIAKAREEWLAFLDADDRYLPNRFAVTEQTVDEHTDADGVYESIGTEFEREELRQRYIDEGFSLETRLQRAVPPEKLFRAMFIEKLGYFSLDGFTCRKRAFEKSGHFNPDFRLSQDTELFIRMSQVCRLYAGELEKHVAMRNVHGSNRSIDRRKLNSNRYRLFTSTLRWSAEHDVPYENMRYLLERAFWYLDLRQKGKSPIGRKLGEARLLWKTLMWNPAFRNDDFWKSRLSLLLGKG